MTVETTNSPAQATTDAGEVKQQEQKPAEQTTATKSTEQKPAEAGKEGTTGQKTEEQKAAVPEKYELKLPEGSPLDASAIERIAAEAKAQGLTNEQAQALLVRESNAVKGFWNATQERVKKEQDSWVEKSKSDAEIGGDNFVRNTELAHRVLQKFGSEELLNELDRTRYGNHPELVRLLSRIGKAMSEDQLVLPNSQGGTKRSIEDIFYGTNEQQ